MSATNVTNIARGREPYWRVHGAIAQAIFSNSSQDGLRLNNFSRDALFKLNKDQWFVLNFGPRDWRTLDRLREKSNLAIERAYAKLLTDYIAANKGRVEKLYEIEARISASILTDDGATIADEFGKLDEVDRQSIFAFRTYAALHAHSHDQLISYFRARMNTDWLKQRFLYPFVYYAINSPADSHLDDFLSYVIPDYSGTNSQTATIKFLLRDEAISNEQLGFKLYVGLLCHPFDACEIFLNHLELSYAAGRDIDPEVLKALNLISREVDAPRIGRIARTLARHDYPFLQNVSPISLQTQLQIPSEIATFYSSLMEMHNRPREQTLSGTIKPAMLRMRQSKYPTVDDFTATVFSLRKWSFTEAVRFLNAYFASQYLFPRRDQSFEVCDVLRLIGFSKCLSPFAITSPSADRTLLKGLTTYSRAGAAALIATVGRQLGDPAKSKDRTWIKLAHYRLARAEEALKIQEWLELVRKYIPVAPLPYISGINWAFVWEIIRALRIGPFEGNTAGIYALLLMQLEDPRNDGTILRTAIEPLTADKSVTEFCAWLIAEYGQDAIAFVRYFLTPEHILMLGLAPNFVAALAGRIHALEECVRTFNFTPLITEEQYERESRLLTASLHLRQARFDRLEIAWNTFKRDVLEKEADSYQAYISFETRVDQQPLLTETKVISPHRYRNGKIVKYEFKNSDWPAVLLIASVIEAFTHHPSVGLEVVLSSRYRHDTLRREFADLFEEAKSNFMAGVPLNAQRSIIGEFETLILAIVQNWMDKYIHSARPGRSDAQFDLAPSQEEMRDLVDKVRATSSFPELVDRVTDWMEEELRDQLSAAKEKFEKDLATEIEAQVASTRDNMCSLGQFRNTDIIRISSAIGSSLKRRMEELLNWFTLDDGSDREPLTFKALKLAVDGVFETAIENQLLATSITDNDLAAFVLEPGQVRLVFDLLSEIYNNSLKQRGSLRSATVRMWAKAMPSFTVIHFSSLAAEGQPDQYTIKGMRYQSVTDAIFREGNSGLQKIAALAASLNGRDVDIYVKRSSRAFHLSIPLAFSDLQSAPPAHGGNQETQ